MSHSQKWQVTPICVSAMSVFDKRQVSREKSQYWIKNLILQNHMQEQKTETVQYMYRDRI